MYKKVNNNNSNNNNNNKIFYSFRLPQSGPTQF